MTITATRPQEPCTRGRGQRRERAGPDLRFPRRSLSLRSRLPPVLPGSSAHPANGGFPMATAVAPVPRIWWSGAPSTQIPVSHRPALLLAVSLWPKLDSRPRAVHRKIAKCVVLRALEGHAHEVRQALEPGGHEWADCHVSGPGVTWRCALMEVGCTRPVARGPDLQEGPLSAQEGPPRTVPPDALLSPTCTHTASEVLGWRLGVRLKLGRASGRGAALPARVCGEPASRSQERQGHPSTSLVVFSRGCPIHSL